MNKNKQYMIAFVAGDGSLLEPVHAGSMYDIERKVEGLWDSAIEYCYVNDLPKPLTATIWGK